MPRRIYDDQRFTHNVTYFGNQWETHGTESSPIPAAYLGTVLEYDGNKISSGEEPEPPSWLEMTFTGTEIEFIGRSTADLKMNYSLDDGATLQEAVLTPPGSRFDPLGASIWKLANLPSDYHKLRIYPYGSAQMTIDYMTYQVTDESQFILGRNTMIVDDRDERDITFTGQWDAQVSPQSLTADLPRLPSGGTWTQTRTNGSTFSGIFNCTHFAVYGYLNRAPGVLRVRYDLGSDPKNSETITHFNGSQIVDNAHWEWTELFGRKVDPGQHKLTATIVELTDSQNFNLDFMTYQAATKAEMDSASGAGSSGQSETASEKGTSPGTIAGAVVGSVAGLALIIVLIWLFSRHKKLKRSSK